MTVRTGLGIAALVLGIVAWLAADAGIWVALAAMILATAAAALRERMFAIAAVVVVAVKIFFVDPTLWTLAAAEGASPRSRTVDAYRIFMLAGIAAPVIAIATHRIESRLTDRIIAVLALLTFAGLLASIGWGVPQLPLLAVFVIAVAMAAYDFWRELRRNGGSGS